jgi:hypothetical protein
MGGYPFVELLLDGQGVFVLSLFVFYFIVANNMPE